MGATLDDAAVLHDDDLVGVFDGGEPMRDDQRRAIAHELDQRLLDAPLGFVVERRRGLVEDQDGRVLEQRARDGDALALAARQQRAAIADRGVEALRQLGGELVDVGGLRRALPRPSDPDSRRRTRCCCGWSR